MWQSDVMNLMLVRDEHRIGKPSVTNDNRNKKMKTTFMLTGL
jgi:hypothetical protein